MIAKLYLFGYSLFYCLTSRGLYTFVPFASRYANDSTNNNGSGSEVENLAAAVYTSSRRASTFAASIFVASPGIHFLHAPIWKSCWNRKREKDSATSISQDKFSRRWLLSRTVPDIAQLLHDDISWNGKWIRAYVVKKRGEIARSYLSLCNQLNPCKSIGHNCARVLVTRYLSSWEKPGIDNELVEKSSNTSFPVFILIDLSSQPYPFSIILRMFRQLCHFLFSIFSAFSSSLIEHVEYLNGVATMNRWKGNKSVTHHCTRCVSDISRESCHWIALFFYSSVKIFVRFQRVYSAKNR